MPEQFTTCDVCNRLIRVEHGPVCVFCREEEEGAIQDADDEGRLYVSPDFHEVLDDETDEDDDE